jgi:hypothetical protein
VLGSSIVRLPKIAISLFVSLLPFACLSYLTFEHTLAGTPPVSVMSRAAAPAQSDKPDIHSFTVQRAGPDWTVTCVPALEDNPAVALAPAKQITTGVWRKGDAPRAVWAGKFTYNDGSDPVEIEIYSEDQGVFRTPWGWFPISGYQVSGGAVRFQVDFSKEVPPSELDRQIIERAAAILSSDAVWNRADTRKCSPTDTKWSIYCAMEKATIEVTGAFHHRRPALEFVRQIVDERTAGRSYHHRLMDYNNDTSTRLKDVQSLFAEALTRMSR